MPAQPAAQPPAPGLQEEQLTPIDGLIKLQRARYYLSGYYGGQRDENDRQAAETVILPLEGELMRDLGIRKL
ncbi:MAG TPA: hypothetical protein VFA60_13915 [Terriglobales bacterium]|nr:hypothetical protein [Terriglobales bacterium]